MKKVKYVLYICMMLFMSLTVQAAPVVETTPLSTAMFIYIPSVLLAVFVSYIIWRMNGIKRRPNTIKPVNRGPVRRPVVAYQRRKVMPEM